MKTITLSGTIQVAWHQSWNTIKLIREDGYAVDLIMRFQEAMESFGQRKLSVRYWLSNKPCTKQEMQEGWLKTISGFASAEFSQNDFQYSEYTSGTDYDTDFKIGNHNMLSILSKEQGEFIIMELEFETEAKK